MQLEQLYEKYKKFIPPQFQAEFYRDLSNRESATNKFQCPQCKGSKVKTDENGVQHDEPCDECAATGFVFDNPEDDEYARFPE